MNLLSEITLKWYDESSLLAEDPRKLVELFMDSLGVSREVASDVFEVLVESKSNNVSMSSGEIKARIVENRRKRGRPLDSALTMRNLQIWLRFFQDLGMVEKIGDRYVFRNNRKPSAVFREKVKPEVVDKSCEYIARLLEEIETRYGVKR